MTGRQAMMSPLSKAIILGAAVGAAGIVVIALPFGLALEEDLGLGLLFTIRGSRAAPPEVVIVGIDRASSEILGLPDSPEKWPRSVHARLTENLAKRGASVIAFDIIFEETRSPGEDFGFARAIDRAGNVVLCECLRHQTLPVYDSSGGAAGEVTVEKLVLPAEPLAESALALAPFPLPRVPFKVSQYWTIIPALGNSPTLPVVVFQVYSLSAYEDFIGLLGRHDPNLVRGLPADAKGLTGERGLERLIKHLSSAFQKAPHLADRLLGDLEQDGLTTFDPVRRKELKNLLSMYRAPQGQYLNFYGPAGSIPAIPYSEVLSLNGVRPGAPVDMDLRGKAVFVGHSDPYHDLRQGFHTVFSGLDGLDLSGVEIAATAFANLVEDKPVRPLTARARFTAVFLWGLVIGIFCRMSPTWVSLAGGWVVAAVYVGVAAGHFGVTARWYPVSTPLLFQTPLAVFGALLWKYLDTVRERRNVRKTLALYLPDQMVDRISKDISSLKGSSQSIFGICLCTDAEHYTALAERLTPNDLAALMNRYYEAVFAPVRRHGGVVSNVVADSMLALWVTAEPGAHAREQACLAALEIAAAVEDFNRSSCHHLPTRIGLHSGQIALGTLGALDRYEYRPVGDMVNTATRIEGLNKQLGTVILMSEDMRRERFLTRELGTFLPAGKSNPLVIHELLGPAQEASAERQELCLTFAEALASFRRGSWDAAAAGFREVISRYGADGPSSFYLRLAESYRASPSPEPWEGVVRLESK